MSGSVPHSTAEADTTRAARGSIAIIGAGPAGLHLGARLARAGHAVQLFDKSGNIGGRVATRERGGRQFNHGAPRIELAASGAGATVEGLLTDAPGSVREQLRPLARGLPLWLDCPITRLQMAAGGWSLTSGSGPAAQRHDGFSAVLCAIPAPQAAQLLQSSALPVPDAVRNARYLAQWALLLGYSEPVARTGEALPSAIDELYPGLSAADGHHSDWVAHADALWSRARLEAQKTDIALALVEQVRPLLGGAMPQIAKAHRWRFARVEQAAGIDCLWDPEQRLGLAGDWCLGPTVGDALASAEHLARQVLQ